MDPAAMASYYAAYGYDPAQVQAYYQQYYAMMQQQPPPQAQQPTDPAYLSQAPMLGGPMGYGGFGRGSRRRADESMVSRVLWLGGTGDLTEDELRAEFGQFGPLDSVRVLSHKQCAFVHYVDMAGATAAWEAGAVRTVRGLSVKVGWGRPDPVAQRPPQEQHDDAYPPCNHLWVGNLSPTVTEDHLRREFTPFGRIDQIKLLPAKNCAFIDFVNLADAQAAKSRLNGRLIEGRTMKVAYGKGGGGGGGGGGGMGTSVVDPPSPVREAPPPPTPPPAAADLRTIIDKFVGFVVRNGPAFESSVREKERSNPKFAFLNSGDGADYYRWKLYCARNNIGEAQQAAMAAAQLVGAGSPWLAPRPFEAVPPPPAPPPAAPLSAPSDSSPPLAPADAAELSGLLDTLTGTKEAIRRGKDWLIAHIDHAPDIVRIMHDNVLAAAADPERRLHTIYLLNDLLHHCLKRRGDTPEQLDPFSLVLQRGQALDRMVQAAYAGQSAKVCEQLRKVLQLWADRAIFSPAYVTSLIAHMTAAADGGAGGSVERKRTHDDYEDDDERHGAQRRRT